ncbi:MAG: uroporphyrinogen-III C-methyltransferase [Alphaproteobacteria bacterium]
MDDIPLDLPGFEPGSVWLVGAGPGDPGLLSLHAVNGLRQADVVVYDALVGEAILDLVRNLNTKAGMVYAGKRGGRPSADQMDISESLISLARDGKRVLRLKGGDPFMFGRGGEEAQALAAAGIPFRLVPGITAGIGGLAYAGIPATHRDVNSAVTFLTGHQAGGDIPQGMAQEIDWQAVAKASPVLVIYMGLKHLDAISRRLMEAGRNGTEAVAIISKASLPAQKVLETTLETCAADAADAAMETPAIIVVGQAVRLRQTLDWLGK